MGFKAGEKVPRHFGETIHGKTPGEVLHFDYLFVGESGPLRADGYHPSSQLVAARRRLLWYFQTLSPRRDSPHLAVSSNGEDDIRTVGSLKMVVGSRIRRGCTRRYHVCNKSGT